MPGSVEWIEIQVDWGDQSSKEVDSCGVVPDMRLALTLFPAINIVPEVREREMVKYTYCNLIGYQICVYCSNRNGHNLKSKTFNQGLYQDLEKTLENWKQPVICVAYMLLSWQACKYTEQCVFTVNTYRLINSLVVTQRFKLILVFRTLEANLFETGALG